MARETARSGAPAELPIPAAVRIADARRWRVPHPALPGLLAWLLATPLAAAELAGDARDSAAAAFAINQALETAKSGTAVPWANTATGNSGTIVPEPARYPDPQRPCRDYQRSIEAPGQPSATVRGSGCRIGAGLWSLQEQAAPAAATSPAATPTLATPTTAAPSATPAPAPAPTAATAATPARAARRTAVARETPEPRSAAPERAPALPGYTLPPKS
jgi:surface antigen